MGELSCTRLRIYLGRTFGASPRRNFRPTDGTPKLGDPAASQFLAIHSLARRDSRGAGVKTGRSCLYSRTAEKTAANRGCTSMLGWLSHEATLHFGAERSRNGGKR